MDFKKLFFFLVLWPWFSASGDNFSGLVNSHLDKGAITFFEDLGTLEDLNSIFPQLVAKFPKLRVMVIDEPIDREDLRGPKIWWRDSKINSDDEGVYLDHLKTTIQSIGFYIAPGLPIKGIESRPLLAYPLVVLKDRSPRHAILHEILHFIQSLTSEKLLLPLPPKGGVRDQLEKIYSKMGEEIFVDAFLLERRFEFKLTPEDICFRVKYMRQNIMVLGSLLGELPSNDKDLAVQAHRKSLYDDYLSAFSLSWDISPCF